MKYAAAEKESGGGGGGVGGAPPGAHRGGGGPGCAGPPPLLARQDGRIRVADGWRLGGGHSEKDQKADCSMDHLRSRLLHWNVASGVKIELASARKLRDRNKVSYRLAHWPIWIW